jgi:thioesterase domain-containing protein/acyl carrier protein
MEARTTPMAGVFYDLAFFIVSRSAGWELKLEYNADVYNRETAEELMRLWRLTLEAVVADPNILLSALPAPTRAVRRPDAALAAIKAAIEAHPSIGECLLDRRGADLFAFVTPAPDRFEALEELPNALREHLTTQGVAPDALAGISVILALPRGANGAPDASRLPTPHRFQPKTATADPALSSARLELEARLARIWSDVLQTPGINAKSHFFDMGGHSMLAVQMIARVRDEFGLRIDPITLFKSPTLRAFAAHLDHEEAPDDDWRVLRLQTRGTKSPVIALNNPMIYHGLAKQIGSDRNFTVLQNYNAGTPQKLAPQKLEDIAAEYVKLVREHQPHGPYTLFGLCGAGMVAFEVAQQLKRSGEKVPLLVMADSFQPKLDRALGPIGRVRVALAERVHDFHLRYDRLRRKEVTLVEFLGSWGIVRRSGVLNLAKAIGLIDRIPVHHDDDDSRSRWFLPHILRARYHYEVGSYDGDILLLRSDEVPRNNKLFPEDFGWSGHVSGKLIVQDVPGLHMTMFNDPGASVVAKAVAPFLEAADELRGS